MGIILFGLFMFAYHAVTVQQNYLIILILVEGNLGISLLEYCQKHYVGRSIKHIKTRIGEHRRHYYSILNINFYDTDSDDAALVWFKF